MIERRLPGRAYMGGLKKPIIYCRKVQGGFTMAGDPGPP